MSLIEIVSPAEDETQDLEPEVSNHPLFELNEVATSHVFNYEERILLYDRFGIQAGDGVCIEARVTFSRPDLSTVRLGDRVFINCDCHFDNTDIIEIQDDVCIGPGVRIITSTHKIGGPERRAGNSYAKPVQIGIGSWIGAGVQLLPGVVIPEGCVIGAGCTISEELSTILNPNHQYVIKVDLDERDLTA